MLAVGVSDNMENNNPNTRIPENEAAVLEVAAEDKDEDEELSEAEKNLALAQARLIGVID